jgi:hypothetical protein
MSERFKPETIEYSKPASSVEVMGLAEFSGKSLADLVELAVAETLKDVPDEDWMELYRDKYNIPEGVSYEDGVAAYGEARMVEYEKGLDAMIEKAKQQIDHSQQMAIDLGYLEESRPVKLLIVEPFLRSSLGSKVVGANRHDVETGLTTVLFGENNSVVAHEVGHALSHIPETQSAGFLTLEGKDENGHNTTSGNQFLNEGMTVLWEEMSTDDGSTNDSYKEEVSLYGWYRDTTKRIIQEIGMPQEDVFKAYFGNEELRQEMESKIQERFNCSLDELSCLSFSLRHEDTAAILDGKELTVSIGKQMHESTRKSRERLAKIFPNVKLVQEN